MDTPTPVAAEAPSVKLCALDRCEVCGAQAYVRTEHEAGPLLWCAHHYRANAEALAPHKVLDERDTLDSEGTTSAP